MRGPLTCLVVLALMVMTPFADPQIALASDYVEVMQWSSEEIEPLYNASFDQQWEGIVAKASEAGQNLALTVEEQQVMEAPVVEVPVMEVPAEEAPVTEAPVMEISVVEDPVTEASAEVEEVVEEIPAEKIIVVQRKKVMPLWRIEINAEQLDLMERCVMAEGGGESYDCQVAIACVIINRVLSDKYPDNVEAVIKQKGQFSTWPGMIENAVPTNEVKQAVREALTSEVIPEDVLYFRAGRYHKWAKRYCRIDNTYFSTPK